jgi:hypothetical protein
VGRVRLVHAAGCVWRRERERENRARRVGMREARGGGGGQGERNAREIYQRTASPATPRDALALSCLTGWR